MHPFLSQLDPNLLSLTGVIFTVLAVIFALGAFYNSRNRKKHLLELEKAQREEQHMHFRPATSHHPGRSTRPGGSSRPHKSSSPAKAAPLAKSSSKRGEETLRLDVKEATSKSGRNEKQDADKQNLFRKVRPDGVVEKQTESSDEDEELYVWE